MKKILLKLFFQDNEVRKIDADDINKAVGVIDHGRENGYYSFKDNENESTLYPLHSLKKIKIIKRNNNTE